MQGPPPEDVFLRLEHVPILDVCVQEFRDKEHYLNTRQMTCVWKPQVNTPKLNNNKMPSYTLISSVLKESPVLRANPHDRWWGPQLHFICRHSLACKTKTLMISHNIARSPTIYWQSQCNQGLNHHLLRCYTSFTNLVHMTPCRCSTPIYLACLPAVKPLTTSEIGPATWYKRRL